MKLIKARPASSNQIISYGTTRPRLYLETSVAEKNPMTANQRKRIDHEIRSWSMTAVRKGNHSNEKRFIFNFSPFTNFPLMNH